LRLERRRLPALRHYDFTIEKADREGNSLPGRLFLSCAAVASPHNRLAAVDDDALIPSQPGIRPMPETDAAALHFAYCVLPQRLQVSGWVDKHRQTQVFEKVRPVASQAGSKTSGQMQGGRELCAPVSEVSAETTINKIKAATLIAVFTVSPFSKLLITIV
jgi:hypothetical protein